MLFLIVHLNIGQINSYWTYFQFHWTSLSPLDNFFYKLGTLHLYTLKSFNKSFPVQFSGPTETPNAVMSCFGGPTWTCIYWCRDMKDFLCVGQLEWGEQWTVSSEECTVNRILWTVNIIVCTMYRNIYCILLAMQYAMLIVYVA